MAEKAGKHHDGPEIRGSAEQKAERIVRAELKKRHGSENARIERKKTDKKKVIIARRLRRETVMTMEWIGRRLNMGSRHTVANSLKCTEFSHSQD